MADLELNEIFVSERPSQLAGSKELIDYLNGSCWHLFVGEVTKVEVLPVQLNLTIRLRIPESFHVSSASFKRQCVRQLVGYHLQEEKRTVLKRLGNGALQFLRIRFDDRNERLPKKLEGFLNQIVGGRPFIKWLEIFLKGRTFALSLGMHQDRYVFVDEIFRAPSLYPKIKTSLAKSDLTPVQIIGHPRIGKTFTAVHLLYDAYCKEGAVVMYCH